MTESDWFDDLPVVGALPPAELATYLRDVGDTETAKRLEEGLEDIRHGAATYGGTSSELLARLLGETLPWQHTAHTYGYFPPSDGGSPISLVHASNMPADAGLKNGPISIRLNALHIADYPGGGEHSVLFDFYAQNQVPGDVEHLHFNATYRAREGEQVAIISVPIFIGLNVSPNGVAFRILTVNVHNDGDEAFLKFLESDAFKSGLKLVQTAQPALVPLSAMAKGLTETIAKRNRNRPVQDVQMGLDFTNIAGAARLAVGSYIAVQIPGTLQAIWNWGEYVYNPNSGQVVRSDDLTAMIPYNYFVFSVSRHEEGTAH